MLMFLLGSLQSSVLVLSCSAGAGRGRGDDVSMLYFCLLQAHYHPIVQDYAEFLLQGAPSQGKGSLPPTISRKYVCDQKENIQHTHTHIHTHLWALGCRSIYFAVMGGMMGLFE